jgi:hypothetical protein
MSMPGFTAETSLYKANGHYQTSRLVFRSVTTAIRAFHPAAEVIEVHGCPPGTIPWIEGDEAVCILTEPGAGEGTPGVPAGGEGGGGFGGPSGRPRKPKRPPSKPRQTKTPPKKYAPKSGEPCYVERSVTSGDVTITDVELNGKYFKYGNGIWGCSLQDNSDSRPCNNTWTDGDGNKNTDRCYNGHNTE